MDIIDRKILCELDSNCRQPLSQLAKKLRIGRNVAAYRIANLEKQGIILKYISTINLGKLGYKTYRLFFKLHYNKHTEPQFIRTLIKNKSVLYCIKTEGGYDYSIAVAVKNIVELDAFIMDLKYEFKDLIEECNFNIVVYTKIFKADKRLLDKKTTTPKIEKYSGEEKLLNIDNADRQILKILSQASNTHIIDIAKKTKLTIDIVKYRLRRLQKELITSNRVLIDLNAIGYHQYHLLLQLKNHSMKDERKIISWCASQACVTHCSKRIGSFDFSINIAIKDLNELNNFISEFKHQFNEILKAYTTMINNKLLKLNYFPF